MNCPVCQTVMVTEDFGGVSVDVCRDGCMGMWLDWFELSKLDDKNEGMGDLLQQALNSPRKTDDSRGPINCPKCSEPLHRHLCSEDKQVNVDECYDCGGFFLDSGELEDIREHHMTEDEQAAYAQKLTDGLPDYQQGLRDLQKDQLRANAIQHFTRFMRLSYYATGK